MKHLEAGQEVILMKEKIEDILNEVIPGVDLTCETLVDSGYISSLVLINLISELDIEFDIEIPFTELAANNFNSVHAMQTLVEKMIQIRRN